MKFRFVRSLKVVSALIFIFLTFVYFTVKYEEVGPSFNSLNQNKFSSITYEKKDWHDWEFIVNEKSRKGPGEQGKPHVLTDPKDIKLNEKLFNIEGLYGIVSDQISVNRSIPDYRPEICQNITYLISLPTTSVIIIYHNEYPSVLKRTIHSIYNRTPRDLLLEILMVNDGSTREELYDPLKKYVDEHFDGRVKIINLPERKGLIVARMEGVRRAKGEVVMLMDAHVEVGVNWLPPLLEPIVINPKACTTPVVGNYKHDTFEHESKGHGSRNVFDWYFIFRVLPRFPQDSQPEKNAALPIMLGCAFAIRKDYFLELGGYDEQLIIWNGENYELSFKLWLCGGELLQVPCSRVIHVFRQRNAYRKMEGVDFVGRNFKRLAEVWLDDYKECLYSREPERYATIDPGDLTLAKSIRRNLNCKPFKYFLEEVMPDMNEKFPCVEPSDFASGAIQSQADPSLCVDTLGNPFGNPRLFKCHENLTLPGESQRFALTWHRNIQNNKDIYRCLDTKRKWSFGYCTYHFGRQIWYYNLTTHQIVHPYSKTCLTALTPNKSLVMNSCNSNDKNQKWKWGKLNEMALKKWKTYGEKLPDDEKYLFYG